jgi:hypothetical protein
MIKSCTIEHCTNLGDKNRNGKRYFPKGYCKSHYLRLQRYGDPLKFKERKVIPTKIKIYTIDNRSKHPLYPTWRSMIRRCNNPNYKSYKHYGARGVMVCNEWLGQKGFWNFVNSVGMKPDPRFSLDRINVNGNYEPSNCRWADSKTQINNRRKKNPF